MRITLTERGTGIAKDHLRELAQNARDASPVFERIARLLMQDERSRFARQPWLPLDPDTVRQRAKRGQPAVGILHATGLLERALTLWRAPGQRLDIAPAELVFGLQTGGDAYYGRFHQGGDGVPKRIVVQATQGTRREVREALLDHLLPGRL